MSTTIAAATPTAPAVSPATFAILALAGWEILAVDIDLAAGRASMEVRRYDGRWLRVDMNAHGATVERWQRDRMTVRTSRRAASYDGVSDTFLGRDRCPGVRTALRYVGHYIADNPAPGWAALTHGQVKAALAPFLADRE